MHAPTIIAAITQAAGCRLRDYTTDALGSQRPATMLTLFIATATEEVHITFLVDPACEDAISFRGNLADDYFPHGFALESYRFEAGRHRFLARPMPLSEHWLHIEVQAAAVTIERLDRAGALAAHSRAAMQASDALPGDAPEIAAASGPMTAAEARRHLATVARNLPHLSERGTRALQLIDAMLGIVHAYLAPGADAGVSATTN